MCSLLQDDMEGVDSAFLLMLYILYCTVLYNGCVVAMDCCYFVTQMYQSYTPLPHFTYQPGVQKIQKNYLV